MELIVATNNMGKLKEFSRILTPLGFDVKSLKQAGIDVNPEEIGITFEENAAIKAQAVYAIVHKNCIADDSGLSVEYLNGAPGVYTARYAGEHATDEQNNAKLLKDLKGVSNRSAEFVSALHLIFESGEEISIRGTCKGTIGFKPLGINGFGYDPIFMVGDSSYAELPDNKKDTISHRGCALKKLVELLEKRK